MFSMHGSYSSSTFNLGGCTVSSNTRRIILQVQSAAPSGVRGLGPAGERGYHPASKVVQSQKLLFWNLLSPCTVHVLWLLLTTTADERR